MQKYKGNELEQKFEIFPWNDNFKTGIQKIDEEHKKIIELLNNLEKQGFKIAVLFITDVIKNGSYVVYNDSAKEIIADSFNISDIKQGIYLQDIVSRKKQMLPNIMEVTEKKI